MQNVISSDLFRKKVWNVFWRSAMVDCLSKSYMWYGHRVCKWTSCTKSSHCAKVTQHITQDWFYAWQPTSSSVISMAYSCRARRRSSREVTSYFIHWVTSGLLARVMFQSQKHIGGDDFPSSQIWHDIDQKKADKRSKRSCSRINSKLAWQVKGNSQPPRAASLPRQKNKRWTGCVQALRLLK